jgi:hypothetical protein
MIRFRSEEEIRKYEATERLIKRNVKRKLKGNRTDRIIELTIEECRRHLIL